MKNAGVSPDTATYNALISAFGKGGRLGEALDAFSEMKLSQLRPTRRTYNAIISACARCENGSPSKAIAKFKEMKKARIVPDVTTYNTLIMACEKAGAVQEAFDYFDEMVRVGLEPNLITYNTMLFAASSSCGTRSRAESLFIDMKTRKLVPGAVSFGSWMAACEKGKNLEDAIDFFNNIKSTGKDSIITFNVMLRAFEVCGRKQNALALFDEMREENITPDDVTFSALASVCEKAGDSNAAALFSRKLKHLVAERDREVGRKRLEFFATSGSSLRL
jgi:leucine-rich PPR motif-containing protein